RRRGPVRGLLRRAVPGPGPRRGRDRDDGDRGPGRAAQPGTRLRSAGRVPGESRARAVSVGRTEVSANGRDCQGHCRRAGGGRLTHALLTAVVDGFHVVAVAVAQEHAAVAGVVLRPPPRGGEYPGAGCGG